MSVLKNISMKVLPAGVSKHFVTAGQPSMPQNPHRTGSQNTCHMHLLIRSKNPNSLAALSFLQANLQPDISSRQSHETKKKT
jgi:hypothetical protein